MLINISISRYINKSMFSHKYKYIKKPINKYIRIYKYEYTKV